MLTPEKVEQIVGDKLAAHQKQVKVEESKKQAISLKIKQSKNLVRRDSSALDSEPEEKRKGEDIEQLRLEILKEMRDNNQAMKDSIADMAASFKKTIKQLKKGQKEESSEESDKEEEKKPDPEKGFGDFILG
mmetsp:Transcript_1772/g.2296  ORF Transcript_1772/g.2296 Transcript_1772/m.2296 type:complete len:132 (+) Transcript_1772:469-864(+)